MAGIRWTEDDLRAYYARQGAVEAWEYHWHKAAPDNPALVKPLADPDGYKSKLERRYAAHLALLLAAKEITAWAYEPQKLLLARRTTYTPDFLITLPDGRQEFHETKGRKRDDAMVKLKVAARLHPDYRFVLVTWQAHAWRMQTMPAA